MGQMTVVKRRPSARRRSCPARLRACTRSRDSHTLVRPQPGSARVQPLRPGRSSLRAARRALRERLRSAWHDFHARLRQVAPACKAPTRSAQFARLLAPQVPRLEIDRFAAVLLVDLATGRKLRRAARIPVEPRAAAAVPRHGMGRGRSACKLAPTLLRCLHFQRGAKDNQDGERAFHGVETPVYWLVPMHDLAIRNALLLDGLGSSPRYGDVGVKDGRIAEIGEVRDSAKETIDAGGLALMPGIIDNHTHYDAQLTWDPSASPSPALGVTTAIIGNCGFTIAPCRPADRDLVMRNLTQVEGMSLEVLRSGIRWEFESVPQYLDMLERQGSALNIASFVGHSALRSYVMGEAATHRVATYTDIAEMRRLVLEAMRAGAIGFSTSTSPAHNGKGGVPMPSRLADEKELRALVVSLKDAGRGVFMLTKGGHTRMAFLEELAAQSTRPVVVAALLHNSTNPDAVFQDLDAAREANARGHKVIGAVSCCPLSMDFTLHSPYTFEGLESWKPALPLKGQAFKTKLRESAFRDAVRKELASPAHFRLFNGQWNQVRVVESARKEFEQRSIAELGKEAGKDPLDFMLDLALEESLDTVFTALLLNSDEAAVGRMLRHPASMVSLSDAGAHLTLFNDAGFGLHLLGHWVRELGVLSLEDAARRLTGQPAAVFGIRGRGALQAGYQADLLLFDPATVNRGPNRRVFDLPGGHPRLTTDAVGVHGVWVNGVRILQDADLDRSRRPGRLLRDFA